MENQTGTLTLFVWFRLPTDTEGRAYKTARRTIATRYALTIEQARAYVREFNEMNWSEFTAQAIHADWRPDPVEII